MRNKEEKKERGRERRRQARDYLRGWKGRITGEEEVKEMTESERQDLCEYYGTRQLVLTLFTAS